jgi:endonuclease/exonuclease/phosphatase (EEP) superfamily protein YafD
LRRAQLLEIMAQLAPVPKHAPVIVGGDLNVPARDGTLRVLRPRLRDAFQQGGIGWGNTAINSLPLWRVDQIWVTNHFAPVAVFAKKTKHSDHRMVICDLVLKPRMNATDLPMK